MDSTTKLALVLSAVFTIGFIAQAWIVVYRPELINELYLRMTPKHGGSKLPFSVEAVILVSSASRDDTLQSLIQSLNHRVKNILFCDTSQDRISANVTLDEPLIKSIMLPRLHTYAQYHFYSTGGDYAQDRNRCLDFARKRISPDSTVLLLLDAEGLTGVDFYPSSGPPPPPTLSMLQATTGHVTYRIPALVPARVLASCVYKGKISGYLDCGAEHRGTAYNGVILRISPHESRPRTGLVGGDIPDLLSAFRSREEPPILRARYAFYLGNAYFDAKNYTEAIRWYERRIRWTRIPDAPYQEIFFSQYRIGLSHLYGNESDSSTIQAELLKAHHIDPFRREPLYFLTRLARSAGNYSQCLLYGGAARAAESPWQDSLWVQDDLYGWALTEEWATCLYHMGRKESATYHWKSILESTPGLPPDARERIRENIREFGTT